MIDISKIKRNILSCAFRGELSSTDDADGANSELDKVHSTLKKYEQVSEPEKLIEVPVSWKWTRIGYITHNHGQMVPQEDFCYIDVGTMDNVNQRLSKEENIVASKNAPSRARKIVEFGDVLYSTVRPYLHNICIIDRKFSKTPIASTAFCVMCVDEKVIDNRFLFYWLLTPEFDKFANGNPSKGMLYPAISEKALLNGVIPLPSLVEQQRIADKIDAVFSVLATLDDLQTRYAADRDVLKGKLINAAICGKLTSQSSEDGTAEELYAQLLNNSHQLEKDGIIKKAKRIPAIAEDDYPFEIPSNWKWIRLGTIIRVLSGVSYDKSDVKSEGIRILRGGNIQDMRILLDDSDVFLPFQYKSSEKQIQKEDIIIVASTGSKAVIGKAAYVDRNLDNTMIGAFLRICRPISASLGAYLRIVFESEYYRNHIRTLSKGTNINNVKETYITHLAVPLPPMPEQNRIVEILDSLLENL